jgi:hypothetical protein
MTSKPRKYVEGNPELLRMVAKERPEFIIEDATASAPTPAADSPEGQLFINAAEQALRDLGTPDRGRNGSGSEPEPNSH